MGDHFDLIKNNNADLDIVFSVDKLYVTAEFFHN